MIELTSNVKNIVKKDLNLSNEHVEVKIYSDSDIASKAVSDHIIEKINQIIDDIAKDITNDIKSEGTAMFFIASNGEMTMLTTGNLTNEQRKICTKMLVASGDHSIILAIVLWIEIYFEKAIYKILERFRGKE